MPPDGPREIMMPVGEHDALTLTHIEALRAVGGQVTMLARQVEGMAADVRVARDGIIEFRAQKLEETIKANRTEAMAEIGKVDAKTDANTTTIARLEGKVIPLASLGSALLTGVLAFVAMLLANLFGQGPMLPPHHP